MFWSTDSIKTNMDLRSNMVEVMQRSYDVIIFILKYLYLRRSVVADFDNIAKITTMLIKATFKDLIKVK